MTYTVIGFTAGIMDAAQLRIAITKHNCSQLVPKMKVLTVRADDFEILSKRFGKRFVNFVLLNDVAVEVCRAVGFAIEQ